jgi:hypothetical protein
MQNIRTSVTGDVSKILTACLANQIHWKFVAQFIQALRYKPEGRGFDSRW